MGVFDETREQLRAEREKAIRDNPGNPLAEGLVVPGNDDYLPTLLVENGDFLLRQQGVIALYGLTTAGKTFAAVDLACTVASGSPWLGGESRQPALSVLYCQLEDPAAMVADRINAWVAEHPDATMVALKRLRHIRPVGFDWADPKIADHILDISGIADTDPLIVFDTLDAGRRTGGNMADEDVGRIFADVLPELVSLRATVVLVAHANAKDESLAGLSRQVNAVANVVHVTKRNGRRVLVLDKSKEVAGRPTIPFDIIDSDHRDEHGRPVGVVSVREQKLGGAAAWLAAYLTERGEVSAADIKDAASALGHSDRALRAARESLGVESRRVGFPAGTVWSIPS